MPLPTPIIEVLAVFRPLFTAPTWRKLMTLLTGTLLAHGRRTVAAALRASGNDQATNWSLFRSVAQPSPLVSFSGQSPASPAHCRDVCESREPVWIWSEMKRWSGDGAASSSLRGHYRDSALSSRERSVSSPGLRWIVMAVVVTLPWTRAEMGLAFLVRPRNDPRAE
jgi:hypothetical protein